MPLGNTPGSEPHDPPPQVLVEAMILSLPSPAPPQLAHLGVPGDDLDEVALFQRQCSQQGHSGLHSRQLWGTGQGPQFGVQVEEALHLEGREAVAEQVADAGRAGDERRRRSETCSGGRKAY